MKKIDRIQKIALENVERYFNGQLILKYNLSQLDISNGINWDYKAENNSKTYQIYLHSLNIINDLVIVGNLNQDPLLFKEARNIILNWEENISVNNEKWNEHAVSIRIKNIIDFNEAEHKYKLGKRKYIKIIKDHCEFLSNEDNYKRNNHGLMMDAALIYSSSIIENKTIQKNYLEKALYRIRFAFYRDFSRKGVHLENSPEYHRLVLNLYKRIVEALKRHGLTIDNEIKLIIENAIKYNRYIIKPNYTYPLLGDTGLIKDTNLQKIYEDFIDYEAGISIFNKEDIENNNNSAFLTFKAGYQSKTHKHYDDLSITYYNFGQDILIDSGKYSYNHSDPIRKFMLNPEAHNTIVVKGKLYKLQEPLRDQHKMKIIKSNNSKLYKLVKGINNLYPGVAISRHVILTSDDILFIVDGISSSSEETIQQNFNFNRNATINKLNDLKYKITINKIDYILETFQVRNRNINSNIAHSYCSEKFANYSDNCRIFFEIKDRRMTFVTTLYKSDYLDIKDISIQNNQLKYNNKENEFNINL